MVVSASTSVCSYKCYGEILTIERNLITLSKSLDLEMASKAKEMRAKFDKYWDGTRNINRMLMVASVFDPTKKMQFTKMCFEKLYSNETADCKEMYQSLLNVINSLFTEYSIRLKVERHVPSSQTSQSNQASSSSGNDNIERMDLVDDDLGYERMDFAYKEMVDEIVVEDSKDELEIYLKEKVENPKLMNGVEYDVLSWWKVNSGRFPVLSEIARDVLAMQVLSVASESAFSTSKRVLEPSRSCLTHYMIEVLMCTE